jgi:hypothetical protein
MAVSVVFLSLAAYVLGTVLEIMIPKKGVLGKWLNPHPVISGQSELQGSCFDFLSTDMAVVQF